MPAELRMGRMVGPEPAHFSRPNGLSQSAASDGCLEQDKDAERSETTRVLIGQDYRPDAILRFFVWGILVLAPLRDFGLPMSSAIFECAKESD
jgi:hypothetical protein